MSVVAVTHEFRMSALCPIDGTVDYYQVTLAVGDRLVHVEDVLDVARSYADQTLFQEWLTARLASDLGGDVTTVGFHSGVRTTVTAKARP